MRTLIPKSIRTHDPRPSGNTFQAGSYAGFIHFIIDLFFEGRGHCGVIQRNPEVTRCASSTSCGLSRSAKIARSLGVGALAQPADYLSRFAPTGLTWPCSLSDCPSCEAQLVPPARQVLPTNSDNARLRRGCTRAPPPRGVTLALALASTGLGNRRGFQLQLVTAKALPGVGWQAGTW